VTEKAGVVILAGGEATRLPGKMTVDVDAVALIVRVYRNVRSEREIVVAGKATFAPEIDALLPVPLVIDRWTRRGPLAGLLTAFAQMRSRYVFAVAGDAPFVEAAFIDDLERVRLAKASQSARVRTAPLEAFVPRHPSAENVGRIEPLAALYDRLAFLREGVPMLRSGRGSLRAVIDRLRTHFVPVGDERLFTNVNTPTDYAALRARLAGERP
jgi:molybdopterin-guanine dinucleotide biosynthesis protein A